MKVSVQYAQDHFQELASAAYNGEPVEIESPEKPVLRLIPSPIESAGKRILGAGRGEIALLTDEEWKAMDEEWKAMDEEIAREMIDAPLMTSGEL